MQEGYGEETWTDGSIYKGFYRRGKKHGKGGVFTWVDGTKYEGDFLNGSITGEGVMKYNNGKRYEG